MKNFLVFSLLIASLAACSTQKPAQVVFKGSKPSNTLGSIADNNSTYVSQQGTQYSQNTQQKYIPKIITYNNDEYNTTYQEPSSRTTTMQPILTASANSNVEVAELPPAQNIDSTSYGTLKGGTITKNTPTIISATPKFSVIKPTPVLEGEPTLQAQAEPIIEKAKTKGPVKEPIAIVSNVKPVNKPSINVVTNKEVEAIKKPAIKEVVITKPAQPAAIKTFSVEPKVIKTETLVKNAPVRIEPDVPPISALSEKKTTTQPIIAEVKQQVEKAIAEPITVGTKIGAKTASYNDDEYVLPVQGGTIISEFGKANDGNFSDGVSIKAPSGVDVRAIDGGTVAYSGNQLKGYGNLVIIKHKDGLMSAYAHLQNLDLRKGQKIDKGTVIGKVGSTGNVSSPQLHFSLRKGRDPINPSTLLDL